MKQAFLLPCGVNVVHERCASPVVYCGIVVSAGTRHEQAEDSGMAHFVEHLSFKGTRRRRAAAVNRCLERVGGDLNAFTGKQETVYHAAVLRPHFGLAADLLCDIVFSSTYPQHEIGREIEVICDEIESYRDTPSELIFDEFEAMIFGAHPLGRDILGRPERLRAYTTADAERFADRYYRPGRCTFFVAGDIGADEIARRVERAVSASTRAESAPDAPGEALPALPQPGIEIKKVERGTHQAHVVMGARTAGGDSAERPALLLLNNLLGGPAMSSRLNTALRERAGLVYSADSFLSTYPDAGLWGVYFGCDKGDVERCRRIVCRELRRLTDAPLGERTLAAAKRQLIGQMGIAREHRESYALALGKTYARYGRLYDVDALSAAVQRVTAAELQAAAARYLSPEGLSTLIYV